MKTIWTLSPFELYTYETYSILEHEQEDNYDYVYGWAYGSRGEYVYYDCNYESYGWKYGT